MAAKPKTIDEYLAAFSEDKRAALERFRKTIRAAAPTAEELSAHSCEAMRGNTLSIERHERQNCRIRACTGLPPNELIHKVQILQTVAIATTGRIRCCGKSERLDLNPRHDHPARPRASLESTSADHLGQRTAVHRQGLK